jgi:hypothetical protein
VPLWLVFRPSSGTVRKVLLFLCWACGGLLALYGLSDVIAGSIRSARGTMAAAVSPQIRDDAQPLIHLCLV